MPRAGLDRDAVLTAAIAIADRHGVSGLTMSGLAEALNVRPPSLYSHFDGLASIEDALTLRGLEGLLAAAHEAIAGLAGEAALEALARSHRNYALAHPGLYSATLRHPEDRSPEIRSAGTAYLHVVLAILKGYGLHGEPALHATRCLHAALRGFVTLELNRGLGLNISVEESFETLLKVLEAGIANIAGRTSAG
ncbi:MAG: TetR/AcrR family transcriptional regulator [Isosphaeraceae bacterium]|nr:TetR/AcrR family transcriptional regulator [Isosphaeraceae bacterium]